VAGLGIVIAWSGYTLLIWGYAKWGQGKNPGTPQLSISDVALPSHRPAYLVAMNAYATASAGGTQSGATTKAPTTKTVKPVTPPGAPTDVGSKASPSGNATTATPGLKGGFTVGGG
jgi:hypothetical protein